MTDEVKTYSPAKTTGKALVHALHVLGGVAVLAIAGYLSDSGNVSGLLKDSPQFAFVVPLISSASVALVNWIKNKD
jgi:hypothetical protein